MTSDEQARAQLRGYLKHYGAQSLPQAIDHAKAVEALDTLEATLRTREAETWEQAAQEVEREAAFAERLSEDDHAEACAHYRLADVAKRLRARAAQPQVDHAD